MDAATVACWPADTSVALVDPTVGDALREAAASLPQTTALLEGAVDPAARRHWSYSELLEASEHAARALLVLRERFLAQAPEVATQARPERRPRP